MTGCSEPSNKCLCCEAYLQFRWSDTHGIGVRTNCAFPYIVYAYEGEGENRKRVNSPPAPALNALALALAQRYHTKTKRRVFPGAYDLGFGRDGFTYSGASREEAVEFNEWLEKNWSPTRSEDAL